jgi:hypothetical protein
LTYNRGDIYSKKTTRKDSKKRTARTGQSEQDCQNRTARTGQSEQDSQNRTVRTGQSEQDSQNWTVRTGQSEQDSQNRMPRAGIHKACLRKKADLKTDSFQKLFKTDFLYSTRLFTELIRVKTNWWISLGEVTIKM